MKPILATTMFLLLATGALAETISYKIFSLQPDGTRKLIQKGSRQYAPAKDIQVTERKDGGGNVFWSKALPLFDAFIIQAHIVRKHPPLNGFGLAFIEQNNPKGFSWEWFDQKEGTHFYKRQGSGRIKISTIKTPGYEELVAVEFLDDVTLRYLNDISRGPGTITHEIVIGKGSVFRVMPPQI